MEQAEARLLRLECVRLRVDGVNLLLEALRQDHSFFRGERVEGNID